MVYITKYISISAFYVKTVQKTVEITPVKGMHQQTIPKNRTPKKFNNSKLKILCADDNDTTNSVRDVDKPNESNQVVPTPSNSTPISVDFDRDAVASSSKSCTENGTNKSAMLSSNLEPNQNASVLPEKLIANNATNQMASNQIASAKIGAVDSAVKTGGRNQTASAPASEAEAEADDLSTPDSITIHKELKSKVTPANSLTATPKNGQRLTQAKVSRILCNMNDLIECASNAGILKIRQY